jgi:hypothetical protein
MGTIVPFLRAEENVFDPQDITAMSTALDHICEPAWNKDPGFGVIGIQSGL